MIENGSLVDFKWLLGVVLALAIMWGRFQLGRHASRQDDFELRIRTLERDSVTHDDLKRIEDKFDKMVDRLDRLLEQRIIK